MTYFKRYRMEIDLRSPPSALCGDASTTLSPLDLPNGFHWLAWDDSRLPLHAQVKAESFQDEIDRLVFPNLGSVDGCRCLMTAIRCRPGFCPAATWLIGQGTHGNETLPPVGTIQGVVEDGKRGAIQNVGVVAEHRGLGIGRALVVKALCGFLSVGVRTAYLEVTARNDVAVKIYRQLGFRCLKTIYLAVELPEPIAVSI